MNFIQQPSGVNFAGNICDIIIESATSQRFTLSAQQGGAILKEEYRPVNGRITVPLRDIMQRVAVAASVEPGVVELPTYQYQFGEAAFQTFTCLNGGVDADVDAIGFFENNWLTWQQQIRRTTFHAPQRLCYAVLDEPSAYKVKVRGYFADNTNSQITLCTLTKRGIHTLDVTYGAISGKFQQQIVAFDVWVEVRAGVNSYTQRYILVDEIYSSDYFMWVNSLGGIDTAIFTGELKEDNKYQTNSAIIDGSESEYNTKVRKAFTKYTGYLGSDNERLWVLDFFNSTKRWHLDDGVLRQITVSSPKLEHTRGELMGYEFTFSHSKQSKYLNITRIEVPELLEVVDPSGELFFLAPRLIQFKSAEVSSAEILFPVQYPHSKEWLQISLTTIIQQAVSAGSGSGQVSKHATSHAKGGSDPVIPFAIGAANINGSSDENFSVKDATVESMRTPGAHEGMISGKGGILKTLANGDTIFEVDFVNIRKSLRASRLTISEIEVEGGITMTGVAKMQIDKVVDLTVKPTDDPQYRANTLRLYFDNQDGKISNHFCVGDQALTKSINTNIDDFQIIHSWRVVKEVGADYIDVYKFNVNTFQKEDLDSPGATITVNREVDSGSGIPREGDVVVACGSISDENRRAYMIVQTIGINAPISEEWSYVSDFRPSAAFNLSKYSDAKQTIHQGDSFLWRTRKGIAPLLLPPEVWVEGTVASYPESYIIDGSTFVCMAKDITETPSDSSDNWLKTSGKGDAGSKGDYLVQGYCWAEDKPQRPVGSSPEEWTTGSDRGVAIVAGDSANDSTEAGDILTDESGAVLLEPYPASYRLWGATATFDAETGEVVGEWSDPYQVSGEVGADGQTPIIYSLAPSATAVKKDKAGALSPANVNCRAMIKIGNEREVIGADPKIEFKGRNLLFRNRAKWKQGVYKAADGELLTIYDAYICSNFSIEVKPDTTYTLQRLSESSSFFLGAAFYDQSGIYLGVSTYRYATQGNSVFKTPPLAKFARFNFHTNPEGSGSAEALLAELSQSQIGLYQGDIAEWQPAPEDYAIQRNGEAYTAGAAVTPSDTVNWTLHDPAKPTTAEPIDRCSTTLVENGKDGNSTNLLSRLSANWQRGVNLGDDGTYRDWDGYICPRKALEVKGGTTYTLQRLSDNRSFSIVVLFYDQSDAYLGAATLRVAIQGNLVFQTPPAAKFARFNFSTEPEGGTPYESLLAELTTSQVGLYQGEVAQWSPAPEDTKAEIDAAAAAAEQAKLDAARAKAEAKEDMAKGAGYANWAALQTAAEAGRTIIKGGHINTDLINCQTLIADNAFVNDLIISQLRILDPTSTPVSQKPPLVEMTGGKQKFGNMEIDQGKVVINGADGRRVELWNTNLTESNAISGDGTIPTTQLIAAMSATSNGVTGSLDATTVSGNSAYFNATVGLGFNCTIVGEVSPFNGIGEVSLYVVDRGGRKELIKTISVIGGGVINEHIISTMPLGGDVRFSIEATARNYRQQDYFTGEFIMYPSTVSVAATTFNFTSDINRLILAPNGYAVVNGSNDYVIMATGIKKIVSPYYNAPGTLRAGSVNANGTNGGAWGVFKSKPQRLSQGTYRITHSIGHKEYFFNGTLVGGFTGAVKRLAKQTSYVDVEVRGLDGNLYDCEFDYQITGANYV